LFDSDVIACEDTRVTGKLLKIIKDKNLKENLEDVFVSEDSVDDLLDEPDTKF